MKRQTLEQRISELIEHLPDGEYKICAHELWKCDDQWISKDVFVIANCSKEEIAFHCRKRWEIFKLNYCPKARVCDIDDILFGQENFLYLEVDYIPFINIYSND